MANGKNTYSYQTPVEELTQALATARKMQHDWLTYGVDYVHLYVEDAHSDWLETWGYEEILGNRLLDAIKEFLISNDEVALRIRKHLGRRSLFELAVNLVECWRLGQQDDRLSIIRNLLAGDNQNIDLNHVDLLHLSDSLLQKLTDVAAKFD